MINYPGSKQSYRYAGWAAIASGITGMAGVSFLIAFLVLRSDSMDEGMRMANIHDAVIIFQFLLLIPVAFALQNLSLKRPPGMNRSTLLAGVIAISLTVIFLLLGLVKLFADVLYMFPQGIFGVWVMIVCRHMSGILSRGLRWFGMVVGFGLALVGSFPLQYAIFVDTLMLQVPAASEEAVSKILISHANSILHQILRIGSPLGVLTLPFWTLLIGRRLLREKRAQTVDLALQ